MFVYVVIYDMDIYPIASWVFKETHIMFSCLSSCVLYDTNYIMYIRMNCSSVSMIINIHIVKYLKHKNPSYFLNE